MENYMPSNDIIPIRNIIKSHLIIFQHSNEKLSSDMIDSLTSKITETIEHFLNLKFNN